MQRSLQEIFGYGLQATDGAIGKVKGALFDDRTWDIRYLIADTGGWLAERLVLLTPSVLGEPVWSAQKIPVTLTCARIEQSPELKEYEPVSKEMESRLHQYYGWPSPWLAGPMGAGVEQPAAGEAYDASDDAGESEASDPHLRSAREVFGYHVQATDGEIGHVDDFLFDDAVWKLRFAVIDTQNWWPGKKVLVATEWFDHIAWDEMKFHVKTTRDWVKGCPEFNPGQPVNRRYELQLYDYYGRPVYWD